MLLVEQKVLNKQQTLDASVDLIINHLSKSVYHLIQAGIVLNAVKEILTPSEFIDWISANMPVSKSQCRSYMRLANEYGSISEDDLYLSLESELALLHFDYLKFRS